MGRSSAPRPPRIFGLLLVAPLASCVGCGPSPEPTRFTPASASKANPTRSDAERPIAPDRFVPDRNIKTH